MIVTVTFNPAIDKSANVHQVQPDRKLRCSAPSHEPGGGGINVARAVKKLGGNAIAVWMKGGPTGERLEQLLEAEGIDNQAVPFANDTRQDLTIFENTTGRQYRFTMPGPEVKEEEAAGVIEKVKQLNPDFLVLSGSLPPGVPRDFYATIIKECSRETKVIIDSSGNPLLHGLRAGVFLTKPNLTELRHMAGETVESDAQIKHAAQAVVREGQADVVVVSLGSAGAFYVEDECIDRIYAPTVSIKSKVGAGDSMVAGIVLKLEENWQPKEAVRYGVAAGAAAVMTPGTELCRLKDTEHLFDQMKKEEEMYLARR